MGGESLVCVKDEDLVKVHVHTLKPGDALNIGQRYGEFIKLKIENMQEQHSTIIANASSETKKEEVKEEKVVKEAQKYGIVAVAAGEGITQLFYDLGADVVVSGGQTMNPSAEDFLKAFDEVNADTVFVLPNNGNVIFAANQAAELSKKDVRVIPTKNVAMGIAAAIAFQNDLEPDENVERMNEAAQHVKTGMVTYAIRDSEYNGIEIKQGDIIGLHNGKIEFSGTSIREVVMQMMKNIITEEDELITVYYGADVKEEDAKEIADEIESEYDACDVECHNGGQPLYYYLISVE